jgi:hypothetical protein
MPSAGERIDRAWMEKTLELGKVAKTLLDVNDKLRGNTESISAARKAIQEAFDRVEAVLNEVQKPLGPAPFGGAERVTPLMEAQSLVAGAEALLAGLMRYDVNPVEAYGDLLFASHLLGQAEKAIWTILAGRGTSPT